MTVFKTSITQKSDIIDGHYLGHDRFKSVQSVRSEPVPNPRYAIIKNHRTLMLQIELIFSDFKSQPNNYKYR